MKLFNKTDDCKGVEADWQMIVVFSVTLFFIVITLNLAWYFLWSVPHDVAPVDIQHGLNLERVKSVADYYESRDAKAQDIIKSGGVDISDPSI